MSKLQYEDSYHSFWRIVIKRPGDECWKWPREPGTSGYAMLPGAGGVYAHRVSWEIHFGEISKGICVLHKCDNPICTNPRHLWLGTKADNNKDCAKKGRTSSRKLNFEQVLRMRRIATKHKKKKGKLPWGFYTRMGKRYRVTVEPIWRAVNCVTFKYLPQDGHCV